MSGVSLEGPAKVVLKDANKVAFWDENGTIYYSTWKASASELKQLTAVFGDRDAAIKSGLVAGGMRYEVHRHHPPAVYGRTMGGGPPESSEGAAIYKVDIGLSGGPAYGFISYQMPNISARMVPILQSFCDEHLSHKSSQAVA